MQVDDSGDNSAAPQCVLVCQNRTCRKQGGAKVLAAFQAHTKDLAIAIVGSGCLGQCGNGPMVLVKPQQVWYNRVHPDEVASVVKRHLREGEVIEAMLYRPFHPQAETGKHT